jgi:hypothetical protein
MMDIDEEGQEAFTTVEPVAAPRKGGWPKGKPRTPRTEEPAAGIRTRKRKGGTLVDKFDIPESMKADFAARGMDVQWKRETVYGARDPSYEVFMREQGFDPVDSSRFPEYVAEGASGPIRRDGMMLMERPMELTLEAKLEERQAADDAVRIKTEQLTGAPDGQFQRHRADGSSTVSINRTIERGGLPVE